MNDAYYEQLVARKSRPLDMVIRFLTILVIVAVAVFGMHFLLFPGSSSCISRILLYLSPPGCGV